MFSILSLFTEDVKLRHEHAEFEPQSTSKSPVFASIDQDLNYSARSPRSHFADLRNGSSTAKSSNSNVHDLPFIPLLNSPLVAAQKRGNSVHPGIVARANLDTTIAVIPAEVRNNSLALFTPPLTTN